ncbi:MAG: hypothetical protein IT370_06925 [Deltaproteobacteria bacterium]|nr:hypothetical protein [Deltaproteobacteria bacterium]
MPRQIAEMESFLAREKRGGDPAREVLLNLDAIFEGLTSDQMLLALEEIPARWALNERREEAEDLAVARYFLDHPEALSRGKAYTNPAVEAILATWTRECIIHEAEQIKSTQPLREKAYRQLELEGRIIASRPGGAYDNVTSSARLAIDGVLAKPDPGRLCQFLHAVGASVDCGESPR